MIRLEAKGGVVVTVSKVEPPAGNHDPGVGIDRTKGVRQTHEAKADKSQWPEGRDGLGTNMSSKKSESPDVH